MEMHRSPVTVRASSLIEMEGIRRTHPWGSVPDGASCLTDLTRVPRRLRDGGRVGCGRTRRLPGPGHVCGRRATCAEAWTPR